MNKLNRRTWIDEQLIEAVKTSRSLVEIAKKLGMKTYGSNSRTIKKHIARLGLDIQHFLSREEMNAMARGNKRPARTQEELLVADSSSAEARKYIKRFILKNSLLRYVCAACFLPPEWCGQKLSLHLDHINGINNDNRLENLRFLCPNCHSQTETYCGKALRQKNFTKPMCQDCGKVIAESSTRCLSCAGKFRQKPKITRSKKTKITWPETALLKQMVAETSLSATGRALGVSDNAVKKRLKNHL